MRVYMDARVPPAWMLVQRSAPALGADRWGVAEVHGQLVLAISRLPESDRQCYRCKLYIRLYHGFTVFLARHRSGCVRFNRCRSTPSPRLIFGNVLGGVCRAVRKYDAEALQNLGRLCCWLPGFGVFPAV